MRSGIQLLCKIISVGLFLIAMIATTLFHQPILIIMGCFSTFQNILIGAKKIAFFQALIIASLIIIGPVLHTGAFQNSVWQQTIYMLIGLVTFLSMGLSLSKLLQTHHHQVEALQSLASTDALTKLVNRGQFNNRIQAEIARAKRHHSPLALALFDIDNFKHLNDYYGHTVGDRILKELGALISENVRESDIAARYGGEEFALVLPETAEKEASELLERLRQMIAETVFCLPDNPITLSVSIGVAELNYRQRQANALELIERADQALYQAKAQGKNKVYLASQILIPSLGKF